MSAYKVIATQGPGVYLLVEKGMDDPLGDARALRHDKLYWMQPLQTYLARGYWEDATLPDDELDVLLEAATEVHPRPDVPPPGSLRP